MIAPDVNVLLYAFREEASVMPNITVGCRMP